MRCWVAVAGSYFCRTAKILFSPDPPRPQTLSGSHGISFSAARRRRSFRPRDGTCLAGPRRRRLTRLAHPPPPHQSLCSRRRLHAWWSLAARSSDVVAGFALDGFLRCSCDCGPGIRSKPKRTTAILDDPDGIRGARTVLRPIKRSKSGSRPARTHAVRFSRTTVSSSPSPRWPLILYRGAVELVGHARRLYEDLFKAKRMVLHFGATANLRLRALSLQHPSLLGIARARERVRFGWQKGRIFTFEDRRRRFPARRQRADMPVCIRRLLSWPRYASDRTPMTNARPRRLSGALFHPELPRSRDKDSGRVSGSGGRWRNSGRKRNNRVTSSASSSGASSYRLSAFLVTFCAPELRRAFSEPLPSVALRHLGIRGVPALLSLCNLLQTHSMIAERSRFGVYIVVVLHLLVSRGLRAAPRYAAVAGRLDDPSPSPSYRSSDGRHDADSAFFFPIIAEGGRGGLCDCLFLLIAEATSQPPFGRRVAFFGLIVSCPAWYGARKMLMGRGGKNQRPRDLRNRYEVIEGTQISFLPKPSR